MKKVFSAIATVALLVLTTVSCQSDSEGSKELTKNSTLTTWLMRVTHTANAAGKTDNDDAPCFTVSLPVTVIINGVSTTISNVADYQFVVNAIEEVDEDDNNVTFAYPLTITFADGTTQTINSDEALEAVYDDCDDDDDDNDDIECFDLNYPITFTYTDATNTPVVLTFNTNDEVYEFLENLEDDGSTYLITYPFTYTDGTGTSIVINNNDELEDAIEDANDECGDGEDDDDDNG